jgi:hypothetical protein
MKRMNMRTIHTRRKIGSRVGRGSGIVIGDTKRGQSPAEIVVFV